VDKAFTILIADRNRNVREFLRREMMAEGYEVRLAKNGQEVLRWVYGPEPLDLVILDLDLPDSADSNETAILEKIEDRIPTLPVVVHTFLSDYAHHPALLSTTAFVEKKGNSVERLKKVVSGLLRKSNFRRSSISNGDPRHPAKG